MKKGKEHQTKRNEESKEERMKGAKPEQKTEAKRWKITEGVMPEVKGGWKEREKARGVEAGA